MEQISRYVAANSGKAFFYTGKPCHLQHDSVRYVSTGGCLACAQSRHRHRRARSISALAGEKVLTVYLPAGQLEEARQLAKAMGWRLFDGREQLV